MSDSSFRPIQQAQAPRACALTGGQFTEEQATHIALLWLQRLLYPDTFELELDYCRLAFARWLMKHGCVGEELTAREE